MASSWTAFVELPPVLVRHGEIVTGVVTEAVVETSYVRRGPSSTRPVVSLRFSYRLGDRTHRGFSQYQPAGDSPVWDDRDRATAAAFIASHPPGSPLQIRTSRLAPWAARPEPPTQSDATRGVAVAFGFIVYCLLHFSLRFFIDRLYLWFRDRKRTRA